MKDYIDILKGCNEFAIFCPNCKRLTKGILFFGYSYNDDDMKKGGHIDGDAGVVCDDCKEKIYRQKI